MVVFDNNVLSLFLHPDADVPNDPDTDTPIIQPQDRIRYLVEQLQESGTRIMIPAPVLSEFLTFASADYLTDINHSMWFEVAPFDQRAAVEAAIALRRAIASGQGKKLGLSDRWQKIKIDRQVVAIAKVNQAGPIYTTDSALATLAQDSGLQAIHVAKLPLPPEQDPTLPFDSLSQPSGPSSGPSPRGRRSRDAEPQ